MSRTVKAFALAAALLSSAACGGPSSARDSDPTLTLFRRNCAACHGPDGAGGQVGQLRVPSLKEGPVLQYTDEQISRQIYDGKNGMPPFRHTLDDEQIQNLSRFVRENIQGRR